MQWVKEDHAEGRGGIPSMSRMLNLKEAASLGEAENSLGHEALPAVHNVKQTFVHSIQ